MQITNNSCTSKDITISIIKANQFLINYDYELNPAQKEAVFHLNGPVLCIAGAGSGKTRTLVYRVARLIELGVNPKQILLLTFTNKAANCMIDRAIKLLDIRAKDVAGGTFHSFAYQTLKRYSENIGLSSNFTVIDESDSVEIINQIIKNFIDKNLHSHFPKGSTIQEIISKSKNKLKSIEDVVKLEYQHLENHVFEIIKITKEYEEFKQIHNLLDFDDLLLFLDRLFKEKLEIKEYLGNYYRYIMIDEYQDTNFVQANIALELASNHNNIMVVGDDAQSIYSFRGADINNILNFPKYFKETKIIKLEQNYRSTQEILNATNKLMTNSKIVFSKTLFSNKRGPKPVLVLCNNEYEQSVFVVQRILDLFKAGLLPSDIAVLFRAGYHSYHLELELKRANINFVKWGGLKFFESAHIKDLLAFVRVIINPLDKIAWQRVLLLLDGVGIKTAQQILSNLNKLQDPLCIDEIKLKNAKVQEQLEKLKNMLKNISSIINSHPEAILEKVVDFYIPYLQTKYYDDYPKRIKDIDQVIIMSRKFADINTFVSYLALEPNIATNSNNDKLLSIDEENGINQNIVLSTIHSAKGLEWNTVFIIWAVEGRFPAFNSLINVDLLEEERRLMYVALTRAKENLYICVPQLDYDHVKKSLLAQPSRFIIEIGNDYFDVWKVKVNG